MGRLKISFNMKGVIICNDLVIPTIIGVLLCVADLIIGLKLGALFNYIFICVRLMYALGLMCCVIIDSRGYVIYGKDEFGIGDKDAPPKIFKYTTKHSLNYVDENIGFVTGAIVSCTESKSGKVKMILVDLYTAILLMLSKLIFRASILDVYNWVFKNKGKS